MPPTFASFLRDGRGNASAGSTSRSNETRIRLLQGGGGRFFRGAARLNLPDVERGLIGTKPDDLFPDAAHA